MNMLMVTPRGVDMCKMAIKSIKTPQGVFPTNLSNTFSSMALMVKWREIDKRKMAIKWIKITPRVFPQIYLTPQA